MLMATLLFVAAGDGLVMKFARRCVKKKNGLSSVEAVIFSGNDAKKAGSALPESNVEVMASKATSGARRTLKPCAASLARALCHSASVRASGRVMTVTIGPA